MRKTLVSPVSIALSESIKLIFVSSVNIILCISIQRDKRNDSILVGEAALMDSRVSELERSMLSLNITLVFGL